MLQYSIENNNKIIINNSEEFVSQHILECGQVFRYEKTDYGYEILSLHHKACIYCQEHATIIICDDAKYFENYFDLTTNYARIKEVLRKHNILKDPLTFGNGIRILKQNPVETILEFIISANNNIPRIRKILFEICKNYGTNMGEYFAFPTIEQLSVIPKEFFTNIKAGYRDNYLFETIKLIKNGFDLENVYALSSLEASKYLQQLPGVGPKVADCILLYGYSKKDVFPTDTWIKKVYVDYYKKQETNAQDIRNAFVKEFGNLSGYAQQYLFYSKRENKK